MYTERVICVFCFLTGDLLLYEVPASILCLFPFISFYFTSFRFGITLVTAIFCLHFRSARLCMLLYSCVYLISKEK